ncbi:MAG: hypothetical protein GF317_03420 [Candidatus Lokiarchaeota archaeon]|nr:hypothetical protein [Candidatus Lokiarchaeota archaeon]MBD3198946.1 hypothetical protein [Candidatus Lokiarchaeota archaeon]
MKFYNPPSALTASGSKSGVELGGSKTIISIDKDHNFYNEGIIYTEMSWAEFYKDIEGLEDQIDTFTTKEFESIREDPDALVAEIVQVLRKIMKERKLFYGIGDFEVDAFMNQNTVIPGLKLDPELINTLMEAHKENRDRKMFPTLMKTEEDINFINISIQGTEKDKVKIKGNAIEDIADRLRFAKGFATGIVVSSKNAANFFIMNDRIIFKEGEIPEFYIDEYGVAIIESGIQRNKLFPVSWFRLDLGVLSFQTLELWDDIKYNPDLKKVLGDYDNYITSLIVNKYITLAAPEKIDSDFENEFQSLNPTQKREALKDMAEAIRELTKKYHE